MFEKIAEALFGKDDENKLIAALADRMIELKKKFGLPFTFKDLNIDLDERRIEELFSKTLDDPRMKNNIVPMDRETVFELIKSKITSN